MDRFKNSFSSTLLDPGTISSTTLESTSSCSISSHTSKMSTCSVRKQTSLFVKPLADAIKKINLSDEIQVLTLDKNVPYLIDEMETKNVGRGNYGVVYQPNPKIDLVIKTVNVNRKLSDDTSKIEQEKWQEFLYEMMICRYLQIISKKAEQLNRPAILENKNEISEILRRKEDQPNIVMLDYVVQYFDKSVREVKGKHKVKLKLGLQMKMYISFKTYIENFVQELMIVESNQTSKNKNKFSKAIKIIAYDMINAVSHLHTFQVLHNDIAMKNFVISSNGHALITDFGLSTISKSEKIRSFSFKSMEKLNQNKNLNQARLVTQIATRNVTSYPRESAPPELIREVENHKKILERRLELELERELQNSEEYTDEFFELQEKIENFTIPYTVETDNYMLGHTLVDFIYYLQDLAKIIGENVSFADIFGIDSKFDRNYFLDNYRKTKGNSPTCFGHDFRKEVNSGRLQIKPCMIDLNLENHSDSGLHKNCKNNSIDKISSSKRIAANFLSLKKMPLFLSHQTIEFAVELNLASVLQSGFLLTLPDERSRGSKEVGKCLDFVFQELCDEQNNQMTVDLMEKLIEREGGVLEDQSNNFNGSAARNWYQNSSQSCSLNSISEVINPDYSDLSPRVNTTLSDTANNSLLISEYTDTTSPRNDDTLTFISTPTTGYRYKTPPIKKYSEVIYDQPFDKGSENFYSHFYGKKSKEEGTKNFDEDKDIKDDAEDEDEGHSPKSNYVQTPLPEDVSRRDSRFLTPGFNNFQVSSNTTSMDGTLQKYENDDLEKEIVLTPEYNHIPGPHQFIKKNSSEISNFSESGSRASTLNAFNSNESNNNNNKNLLCIVCKNRIDAQSNSQKKKKLSELPEKSESESQSSSTDQNDGCEKNDSEFDKLLEVFQNKLKSIEDSEKRKELLNNAIKLVDSDSTKIDKSCKIPSRAFHQKSYSFDVMPEDAPRISVDEMRKLFEPR